MLTPTRSSKPSAVSVTDLTRRYHENPFFRSTVNVIALQALLVVLSVIVFGAAIWYQQHATITVIQERRAAIRAGQTLTPESLDIYLRTVRDHTLGASFGVLILLALTFGFLSSRFALRPSKESLQVQKRFIGNIAHEIRTPLAIIKTNTEVALMDPRIAPDVKTTMETTLSELTRISETINNLLSFDALVRPGRISSERIDLAKIIATVVERHTALAESRSISLTAAIDGPLPIIGNEVAVEQVFTNLVKNAINYTPEHSDGSVTVLASVVDDNALVSVADTGIGIAKKDLYHVFEPFYRADTSRTRGIGSAGTSGLGLAIVNDIVRLHRGTITLRSAVGRGTTIEISLPLASGIEEAVAEELNSDGEYEAHLGATS